MPMPPTKISSSARWLQAIAGIGILAALVWLVASLVRPREVPRSAAKGAVSTSVAPRRAPAPLSAARRLRAGVAGHVVDAGGAPVAGASVCVWASLAVGLATAQAEVPRCGATDAAGAYAIDELLSATPLVVTAGAARSAPQRYRGPDGDVVRLQEGQQRRDIDFVLRGGGVAIEGRVSDVTGGVVGGAVVMSEEQAGGGRAVAKSDDKGAFTLWVDAGQVTVDATAQGYAPGKATGLAPGNSFAIHLVPGATLVGRAILAGAGTPVGDALIEAIQVEGGVLRAKTRTDDEGRFKIDALQPGRYRIEATAEALEGYSSASVTLGMGETSRELVVELDPAFVVRGRVIDKDGGKPCEGGTVTITDQGQNEYSEAPIEPDGWARMASVIPGTYKVRVTCRGHIPRDDFPVITIKDRDAPEQTWEVDPGARVRVVVVDGMGFPVRTAHVMAGSRSGGPSSAAEHVEADGAFLLAGLAPGEHDVRVNAQDGSEASKQVTLDALREAQIRIELPSTGAIDGVVEDEDRRPVGNVQIVAFGPGRADARSTDDGKFSLTGLPAGEYEVRADEPSDGQEASGRTQKVVVRAPGRATARLTVARRDGVIEGRVTDRDGHPVTDAFIDVGRGSVSRDEDTSRGPVLTDTDGRFKIERLEPGEYSLRAHRKGAGEAIAEHVKLGTRDVALRLAAGASISGTLTSALGPVARFQLYATNAGSSFQRGDMFFHSNGVFAIGDLPAGTYELTAYTPNGTGKMRVTLAEGEQKTDVAMTLLLRGAVEGQITTARGAPLAGVRVVVVGDSELAIMGGGNGGKNITDQDGRFRVDRVLSGNWKLMAVPTSEDVPMTRPMWVPVEVSGVDTTDVGVIRVPEP